MTTQHSAQKKQLSVVLATKNEEANITKCLESVKGLADEIIIFDEQSTDATRSIAKSFGARVYQVRHEENFHITKQKSIAAAEGEWILQLDADEVVTEPLRQEIKQVLSMSYSELKSRRPNDPALWSLFTKHTQIVETRDGTLGKKTGEIVAFFIPRRNLFIGKPLSSGGRYPDGVIRLIKNGKARLPAKSVHEQMELDGEVAWLFSDLLHNDSPTIQKYIARLNRYTDLHAVDLDSSGVRKDALGILIYTFWHMPIQFLLGYIRFRGYRDGIRGFIWAIFSACHYPLAYYKFYLGEYSSK